ncbi:RNA ligase/cyclic nucleotide phosphodiesterase [Lasiosphaeria miniovina]|uniref:RNA ligase/cyclic nucleotide phosphodiesterase n=1 Tax=Lasiosphaeria miniovina TaxID=1954250 RepID=A0AA40BHU7_9PEZI|nr:RNA ligase/cyclic nucleotide phosphodiesterase [Lasiosphaeria miniovina]KAK0734459.1 RNA ligase/cyclic nucleotide phosphodiesterase [Lasiosphaeria miniovina]
MFKWRRRQKYQEDQLEQQHQQFAVTRPHHPVGVPRKFDPDGNVQRFPGNTILCHLSPSSELYGSMQQLYDKLAASPLAHLYALLPPPSWHMTVFDGVCDQVRAPGSWPRDLAADAPLEACTARFAEKLAAFDLQCGPPLRLTATAVTSQLFGICVNLRLQTADEESRFRTLRDLLADALQIRHPHHANYGLHLSMAYYLSYLDQAQADEIATLLADHFRDMPKEFELGAPEFCTFENMSQFDRLFYLKNQG